MRNRSLALLTLLGLAATDARAADLGYDYLRGADYDEPALVTTPLIDWSGTYVGGHAGYRLQLVVEKETGPLLRLGTWVVYQQRLVERLGGFESDRVRGGALAGNGSCRGLHEGHIWQLMNTSFGPWERPRFLTEPAL